ncbi:hypothetical protein AGR4A_Cc20291 [Agrobacterium tumefaciens str. B6]|uniref:Uncharacterized protein n=1 Tax=Agrobacterium tumefaciens str. B6 TaxID=1183423 RepID=A0A822V180_AGRTU|nr:hypothetical protein AGR4A_Cc20291 [Agrobacterium tumefaciens str. B6]
MQQICQTFDLKEVHLPVLEGSTGKFAGISGSKSTEVFEFGKNRSHNRATAVAMNFDAILTGERIWRWKSNYQRLVDHLIVSIPNRAECGLSW